MKKHGLLKKILLVFLILVVVVFVFRDFLFKTAICVFAGNMLGAPVKIDKLSIKIPESIVVISGLKIYNPPGFSKAVLVDLPKIEVVYDLQGIKGGNLHLPKVGVELKEMILEKNRSGELNVDSLKIVKEGQEKGVKKKSKPMPMRLDLVSLGIGKIVNIEYSKDQKPLVKVYDINLHKTYKNITSAQQLALLILTEPMKSAGIRSAKIYGVAMLTSVAVLPVAVAATFAGKDSVKQDFRYNPDVVFEKSISVLERMGRVSRKNKGSGVIDAWVNSAKVRLEVRKKGTDSSEVVISARKYLFPRPELAGGIMYEISRELK